MLKRPVTILVVLLLSTGGILAQTATLPFGTDHALVFIEPFRDLGPDTTQTWLVDGLRSFLETALGETRKIDVYQVPVRDADLYYQPHLFQEQVWMETFGREVDERYDTYLVRGSFSHLDEHLEVTIELYFMKTLHKADQLNLKDRYAQLKNWKVLMGDWLLERLERSSTVHTDLISADAFFPAKTPRVTETSLRGKLETLMERKSRSSSADLYGTYQQQSYEEMGSQLERLWHDVAFDPYLAEIHDIKAQRDRMEPDSVLIDFLVTYRINPRILDEIRHFTKSTPAVTTQEDKVQSHLFMDLGYTDQAFVEELAQGDWRLTPIVSVGPENYPGRRIFYHAEPRPIDPPTVYHLNNGQFKQLIMGLPGVNALRIYTLEESATYRYRTKVAYEEMPLLDKISVRFVLERDLHRQL